MAHQQVLFRLQGGRIEGLLKVIPHQEAAQLIGALTNLVLQGLKFFRARHEPRDRLHLLQLIEGFLYLPGVISILAGQTRLTRQVNAPFG